MKYLKLGIRLLIITKREFDSLFYAHSSELFHMTYQELKNRLDRIFASYIRLRDNGKPCISCGVYTGLEAGHLYSRGNLALRWDERNVHGQCIVCNRMKDGNLQKYRIGIILRYNKEYLNGIDRDSSKRVKYKAYEIMDIIEQYQDKIKKINKDTSFLPKNT